MFKKLLFVLTIGILSLIQISASAHVVVKPAQVNPGSFERFAVGVPVEKEIPTVGIRLIIPEGLNYISPYVKTGWKIDVKKDNSEKPKITEISWTGGNIPVGQKDEFIFSAQVPATDTEIKWKAYQTYSDGSVVNWDMEPVAESKKSSDDEKSTPYSITKVSAPKSEAIDQSQNTLLYVLVGLSIVASIATGVYVGKVRH